MENNIIRFIKNWTLPVAIATGSLVYLVFAYVPALDSAAVFFTPVMEMLLPLFMFFTLFVVFCKVDFRQLQPVRWLHPDLLLPDIRLAHILWMFLPYEWLLLQ